MRPRAVAGVVAVLACAGGAGVAGAALDDKALIDVREADTVEVELDGDSGPERVAVRRLSAFRWAARLEDDCNGRTRQWRLIPVHDAVAIDSIRETSTGGPTYVFASGSSGASSRIGDFAIVGLGPGLDRAGCPVRRYVFRYPHPDFALPRPPRGTTPGSYSAAVRSVRGALQVQTVEGLYRRTDGGCCPSFVRTSDWRLEPRATRFQRIRSRIERVPRPD